MGNDDGLVRTMASVGSNEVEAINDNMYFSMAHGNEIALVKNGYFILNFNDDLWDKTKKKIKELKKDEKKLIKWWINMSKKYEISIWSNDFKDLH